MLCEYPQSNIMLEKKICYGNKLLVFDSYDKVAHEQNDHQSLAMAS